MRKLNKRSKLTENTIEAYSGVGCPCNIGCTCSCYCNQQSLGNSVSTSNSSSTLSSFQHQAQQTPA